jgi:hypothetical protein
MKGKFRDLVFLFGGLIVGLSAFVFVEFSGEKNGDSGSKSLVSNAGTRDLRIRSGEVRRNPSPAISERTSSHEAEMKRLGILRSSPDVSYSLLGEDGEITSHALEVAGLEYEDRVEVKKIVDKSLSEISRVIAEKTRVNKELSNEDRGYFVYDIPSFAEEGENTVASLASQLSKRFGEGASDALIAGLHTSRRFAGFGKFESRIVFDDNGPLVNPLDGALAAPQFTLTLKDPKTGRIIQTVRSTNESLLKSNLGDSFLSDTQK